MVRKIRLSGCGIMLALIVAACGDQEGPVAPESGPDSEAAPAEADAAVLAAVRFGTPQRWSTGFCRKGEVCLIGDVDGDGRNDAIAFNHGLDAKNAVYVARSSGTGFGPPEKWSSLFCRSTETCAVGDVNGDGETDVIAFTRGTAKDVWVALSNKVNFSLPQKWSDFFCKGGEVCKVADVNGDNLADLVAFRHGINGDNSVFVAYSTGSGFGPAQKRSTRFCLATETCEVGPVGGGKFSSLIAFTRDPANEVYVSRATGSLGTFYPPQRWSLFFCRTGEVCQAGDFNGDERSDVIAFNHGLDGTNAVYVALSNGATNTFDPVAKASDYFCTKSQACAVGDVTGDGRADVIAFTRGTNPQAWVGVSLP
jgi:hypothetical protein